MRPFPLSLFTFGFFVLFDDLLHNIGFELTELCLHPFYFSLHLLLFLTPLFLVLLHEFLHFHGVLTDLLMVEGPMHVSDKLKPLLLGLQVL